MFLSRLAIGYEAKRVYNNTYYILQRIRSVFFVPVPNSKESLNLKALSCEKLSMAMCASHNILIPNNLM